MYNSKKNETEIYVVTYKELIFILVSFSIILIILFPRGSLMEKVLSEQSNYDLSILYLKNILKNNPKDESLMLILAQQSLKAGKRDLAIRLLELLHNSKNKKYKREAILLSYNLHKKDFYNTENNKEKIKNHLIKLLNTIVKEHIYTKDDINKWYQEAVLLNKKRLAYNLVLEELNYTPKKLSVLSKAYYLSYDLRKYNESNKILTALVKYDIRNKYKWVDAKYYIYLKLKEYNNAEDILKKYAFKSTKYKIKLAEFYMQRKDYKKSSYVFMSLFKQAKSYKTKKSYFYKAISALRSGELNNESAYLGRGYEEYYIKDKDVRKFLLDLYLSTGHLDYAHTLSKKILNRGLY